MLGRYELGDEVGEGGMATVYRARDRELRRDVAVKVLFPHLAKREEIVRRFHREARAAASLEHPNILRIYDVGGDVESEDPPFIVMELVRGTTLLGEIEQRGPMFAEVVACVGALLADALIAAHGAGIVHRDIKPANVLVAPGGRLLLADFGVARLETEDSLVTKTGALLGTPAYMSPEQSSGDIATAKSDLYSLGATLYQLATGTLPYPGSPAKVMAALAAGPPVSAVKKRAEVGPELSALIVRLMMHDPAERPANAAEVGTELRRIARVVGEQPAVVASEYFADPAAFVAAHTPAVVKQVIADGRAAIAAGKLPRAMAFADRAMALAPDDPEVLALVSAVTEGERGGARKRMLVIGVIGAAVVGGGGFAAVKLVGGSSTLAADAAVVVPADGAVSAVVASDDTGTPASPSEAGLVDAAGVADAVAVDAGVRPRVRDAAVASMASFDASITSFDAAVMVIPPVDAAPAVPETGTIVVSNVGWCDITIDATTYDHSKYKLRTESVPITVPAGRHTVTCAQPGTNRTWRKDVDVVAGTRQVVSGGLTKVTVTFEVSATLDGRPFARGGTTVHDPGRFKLVVDDEEGYVTLTQDCVVRRPNNCDPR